LGLRNPKKKKSIIGESKEERKQGLGAHHPLSPVIEGYYPKKKQRKDHLVFPHVLSLSLVVTPPLSGHFEDILNTHICF